MLAVQLAGPKGLFSDPDPLPAPPTLEHYLLESPLGLCVGLGVLAVLLFVGLRRAGKPKPALAAGGAAALLAGGVWLLAASVTTERERLQQRTRDLIGAAIAADGGTVERMLRDDVSLTLLGRPSARRKPYLVDLVRQDVVGRYNAKESAIRWVTAAIDGGTSARTQTKLVVRSSLTEGDLATTWLLEWRKDAQGQWQVWRVEAQQIGLLPQGSLGDV